MTGFFTYRDLLAYLDTLTDAELAQPVAVLPPTAGEEPRRLEPVFEAGTVAEFCHDAEGVALETRGPYEFRHDPAQVVLLRDYPTFSRDGDTYYTLQEDGSMVGDVTGKVLGKPGCPTCGKQHTMNEPCDFRGTGPGKEPS
jgi:hypothetical protein